MVHNPNIVLLGNIPTSVKEVTTENADPAAFPAGFAVRRASNGGLQLADNSTAALIGVSLGADLSDASKTAVCRTGNLVPLRVKNDAATLVVGDLTFTSKLFGPAGNDITIALVDTGSLGVVVSDSDIVVNIDAEVTTADAIASAVAGDSEASALVSVAVASGEGSTAQSAAAEANLTGGSDFCVPGKVVLLDDTTGEASVDGDPTAAHYLSVTLTGVNPDGSTVPVALIGIPGGF